jgi:hypothetical protein
LTQYHSNDVALKESWAIMHIPYSLNMAILIEL